MRIHPNRAQWKVLWVVAIAVLGLWLADIRWDDLTAPSVAVQLEKYTVYGPAIEAAQRTKIEREATVMRGVAGRTDTSTALGRRERDRWEERANLTEAFGRIDSFQPDYRGESARTTLRNRVGISVAILGFLLFWQLAGQTRIE